MQKVLKEFIVLGSFILILCCLNAECEFFLFIWPGYVVASLFPTENGQSFY